MPKRLRSHQSYRPFKLQHFYHQFRYPSHRELSRDEFEAHNTGSTAKASNTGGAQENFQQRPQLDRNAQRDLPPAPLRRVQHNAQFPSNTDLQASVHSGTWATQFHNEQVINHAFHEATNVYLIFSANKSGEYFGYARMMSEIAGERGHLSCFAESDEAKYYGMPKSTSTLPTKTAPSGRIVDDIARGTLFWEAKHSENEAALAEDGSDGNGHTWGRQFKIEWLSTSRLPFYPTRGLRNPWNANREVKIARDGTELEPGLGRRLVQMCHNPLPSHDRMASVELAIPRTLYQ
ncbi:hypothetical protein NU195Hw_Modified_179t1 [Hortaea werneckii]